MQIIIVGCGKVGYAIAEQLNDEGHDITIIDTNREKVEQELNDLFTMEQEIDIRTCSLSQIEGIDLTMEQMHSL